MWSEDGERVLVGREGDEPREGTGERCFWGVREPLVRVVVVDGEGSRGSDDGGGGGRSTGAGRTLS
jgi:hypothetical protein